MAAAPAPDDRCVVCGGANPAHSIRRLSESGHRERVESHLGLQAGTLGPQYVVCEPCQRQLQGGTSKGKYLLGAVLGAGAVLACAPVAVAALGFGAGGIAAGSLGASMMSASATYGVVAGIVATLQSIGAAGFSLAGQGLLATVGAAAGTAATKLLPGNGNGPDSGQGPQGGQEQDGSSDPPGGDGLPGGPPSNARQQKK